MLKYFKETIDTIENSLESLDEEIFEKLVLESVNAIKSGHKIVVTGLGKNVPICEKFVGTMLSLGLSSNFLHTNSAVHGDMGMIMDGDLVIMLTKSGNTKESIYLAEHLLKRDTNIWLLTFSKKSTLSEIIKKVLILNLKSEGDQWNIMPNNSSTVNLIVLQALAMSIAERLKLNVNDFLINHPGGAIGEKGVNNEQ